ncbi:hypothetical protein TRFO_24735 [Tritrichomonas foetus]|uniref:Uncharacterized protein n=1 Tax=Tritrichomonas foetus TaxID=1144522 RepID=A0A1J4K752_9EUKA|nr:hypothetical protein TRFO_24735 [Tritrichomonas foetus]|eukprot:OHT07019.1 hypothetical protein TRFO_24735 [Tritrichomonas foetus]
MLSGFFDNIETTKDTKKSINNKHKQNRPHKPNNPPHERPNYHPRNSHYRINERDDNRKMPRNPQPKIPNKYKSHPPNRSSKYDNKKYPSPPRPKPPPPSSPSFANSKSSMKYDSCAKQIDLNLKNETDNNDVDEENTSDQIFDLLMSVQKQMTDNIIHFRKEALEQIDLLAEGISLAPLPKV